MVIAPAEWTPANITFLVSIDGVNFFDLADAASGVEISRARKRPNNARMRMIPTADPASAGCGPTFHFRVPQRRCCA